MPPYGLYQVPRHHLSRQMPSSVRPVFNSNEFDDATAEQVVRGDTHEEGNETEALMRKKKHLSNGNPGMYMAKSNDTPPTPNIATPSRDIKVQSKNTSDIAGEPVAEKAEVNRQKRKRRNTTVNDLSSTPGIAQRDGSFHMSNQYLEDLRSSMGDLGKSFSKCPSVPIPIGGAIKKQKKAFRKSDGDTATSKEAILGIGNKTEKEKSPKVRSESINPATGQTGMILPPNSPHRSTKLLASTSQKMNKAKRANSEARPHILDTPRIESKKKNTELHTDRKQMTCAPINEPSYPNGIRGAKSQIPVSNPTQYKNSLRDELKPRSRLGVEIDPFVVPSKPNKKVKADKPHGVHDEGSLAAFTIAFTASQKTVNFTDEKDYLKAYITYHSGNAAAGPLPCLNKVTGCNPKRERLLQLQQPDANPRLDTSTLAALTTATARSITAEKLLTLAVTACIPIPLGRIDGEWKLYCPTYAAAHIDKYSSGQRTLHIAPVASAPNNPSSYTASLALPPRSMPFTIHAFDAPPHASFRATRLNTLIEGYALDVVFLGNGYLRAFIDLQELLMGKKMEGREGRAHKMEFWGVQEEAQVWEEGEEGEQEEEEEEEEEEEGEKE